MAIKTEKEFRERSDKLRPKLLFGSKRTVQESPRNMMRRHMERLQEKKPLMRSKKHKGPGDYFERLICWELNDFCEQLVSMGIIKRLIEITRY